ncbi:MAG: YitT family protein [Clostridiaceae bacterium]|nr:YitT family protein [Eubacteriales bacterium]
MPVEKKKTGLCWKEDALTLLLIAVVAAIQAVAINGFYVPHHFLSGGITGVALLAEYLFDLPSWIVIVVLNIPVCIVGWRSLNFKFVLFSLVATVLFSVALALTHEVDFGITNPIVSALAGAAVVGVTAAPVVKRDATMGGMDVIAAVLSRKYSIPMGTFSILYNVVIMGVLAAVSGLELGLMSMLAMFVSNTAFNAALVGLNRTVTVFIISDKWEEIAPLVITELHRGVTYIPAEGAYTGQPRKLVYVILKTSQLAAAKRIVKSVDATALFSIIETKEVLGRGFGSLN